MDRDLINDYDNDINNDYDNDYRSFSISAPLWDTRESHGAFIDVGGFKRHKKRKVRRPLTDKTEQMYFVLNEEDSE